MIFSSEFVLPGHPDKLCDAAVDCLVAAAQRLEKRALCALEAAVHRNAIFLTGRLACQGAEQIDIAAHVRGVFASAGYGGAWIPDPDRLEIHTDLCLGPLQENEAELRACSDDQSIVTGFAVDLPATNFLPVEHWLAHRLARALTELRATHPELQLGPDGKLLVVYDESRCRLEAFSASLQQAAGASEIELNREVRQCVQRELEQCRASLDTLDPSLPEIFVINGCGSFHVGGPEADNGLSGKKPVVDAYGPRIPIGGGALSGKDFYKPDRAGALLARRLAKAVVLSGAARQCVAMLAIFPGDTAFRIIALTAEDGRPLDPRRWASLTDLRLEAAGDAWTGAADPVQLARHGHFTDPRLPWETIRF
jgi:S-adenosylmethionine synthetase